MTDDQEQHDVTRLLKAVEGGDDNAHDHLMMAVYDELRRLASRRMANEPKDHTLQTTALVHEAYLRLVKDAERTYESRSHFFRAAAQAMRRILVERARRTKQQKRGGGRQRLDLDDVTAVSADPSATQAIDLLTLDELLDELREKDPRMTQIVTLRFFAGLDVDETAEALDVSARTVKREWAMAKAWLYQRMGASDSESE